MARAMGKSDRKAETTNAVAAFHHAVAKGDIEKVKSFVLGTGTKSGPQRVNVNSQDEDGMAAVHWAAMRGHKNVLKFLVETAPENNRADVTLVDNHGWSAVTWAIFMIEQESKMVGTEHPKRRQLCDVINYLVQSVQGVKALLEKGDRLLHKSAQELAKDAADATDEAVLAAIQGTWEASKTYGLVRKAGVDG